MSRRARGPRCWRKSLGGAVKGHYMSAMPFLRGARYINLHDTGLWQGQAERLCLARHAPADPQRA